MVAKEIQKRNGKAQNLRVLQTEEGQYYVESSSEKVLYRCIVTDSEVTCTCGDFARNIKNDPNFRCKHLLAVMNCASTGEVENGQFLDKVKPKLDDRFIKNIKGKDFVLYAGLLDLGHQKGIQSLRVSTLQVPTKENGGEAISKATLESKLGEIYEEIGHATNKNVNYMVAEHLIHMSATRAKARALRDYTNVGITALEELGNLDDVIGDDVDTSKQMTKTTKKTAPRKNVNKKQAPEKTNSQNPETKNTSDPIDIKGDDNGKGQKNNKQIDTPKLSKPNQENSNGSGMSEAQRRACMNLSRRRGISIEELESMCQETFGTNFENLNVSDASSFIRQLQTAA